jgi:cholecystokinin A receptor/hypocretin (orexin) receptor 2
MLFVVTVVFIVTFLPAFLMALSIIPYNIIVFYMYFANNVANPVIYSFMNKNFRDDLKTLFCRQS